MLNSLPPEKKEQMVVVLELTELELNLLEIILDILELLVGDGVVNVFGRHFDDCVRRLKCKMREIRMLDAEGRIEEGELLPLYKVEPATR